MFTFVLTAVLTLITLVLILIEDERFAWAVVEVK